MENKVSKGEAPLPSCTWRLRVCQFAQAQGYSQEQLVAASGLSEELISRIWETPDSDISLSALDALAHVLGVRITDLIEEVTDTPPEAGDQ